MALIELTSTITAPDREVKSLYDLVNVLQPVKHAVEEFCKRDATLLTDERIHRFVPVKLSSTDILHSLHASCLAFGSE